MATSGGAFNFLAQWLQYSFTSTDIICCSPSTLPSDPPACGGSLPSLPRFSPLPFLSFHSSIRLVAATTIYIHTSTYIYNLMHWCAHNERDWHKSALNAHGTRHFHWQTGVQSETYMTHIPKGTERRQRVQRWQVVVVVVVVVVAQLEPGRYLPVC